MASKQQLQDIYRFAGIYDQEDDDDERDDV
jgi:hypothetical protein